MPRVAVTVTTSDDTTSVSTFQPEIGQAFGVEGFEFVSSQSAPDTPVARTAVFDTDLPEAEIPAAVERAIAGTNERVADFLDTTVDDLTTTVVLLDVEILEAKRKGPNVAAIGLLGLGALGLVAVAVNAARKRGQGVSGLGALDRDQVLEMFQVNDRGIITSPGKFEGEMLYVPSFWDEVLDGGCQAADLDGDEVDVCKVEAADRRNFPELGDKRWVVLEERGDGFVMEAPVSESEVRRLING